MKGYTPAGAFLAARAYYPKSL